MPGDPDDGNGAKRPALDQLPNKQRALLEQRADIVRERGLRDEAGDSRYTADREVPDEGRRSQITPLGRTVRAIGVIVVVVIGLWLLVALIGVGASLR